MAIALFLAVCILGALSLLGLGWVIYHAVFAN